MFLFLEPPLITFITTGISASVNDSVELECIAFGYPNPTLLWIHMGYHIVGEISSRNETIHHVLRFPSIQTSNMGEYICVANNKGGEDRAETHINVKGENLSNNVKTFVITVFFHLCSCPNNI